jgi:plastocyanin
VIRRSMARTGVGVAAATLMIMTGLPGLPAASAATQAVTITAGGFVPGDLTIQPNDSVTFTNADSTVHQVEFKTTTGVTCSASPLVIQPGTTGSCTFATAGTFSYSDPNFKGNTFRASVTVEGAAVTKGGVTLTASKKLLVYGAKVALTGKIASAKGGVSVDLWARPYPEPAFAKIATVTTEADGTYAFSLPPRIRTEYRAQYSDGAASGQSTVAVVKVRPKVTLKVKSVSGRKAKLRTRVISGLTYAATPVLVQRRNSQGGWTTVKTVRLGQFSALTFKVAVPKGTSKWRVYLQASQAGGGYEASYSPIRSVRR